MYVLTRKTKIAIAAVFCCLFVFFAVGGTLVWAQTYEGRMAPRTYVGTVDVSGLDRETARQRVSDVTDDLYASGAPVLLDGKPASVPLSVLIGSDAIEIVHFDLDATVDAAYAASHAPRAAADAFGLLRSLVTPVRVRALLSVNEDALKEGVRGAFPERESPAKEASFTLAQQGGVWTAEVVEGAPGDEFDFKAFLSNLMDTLEKLDRAPTPLTVVHRNPDVSKDDAETQRNEAVAALARAPYLVEFAEEAKTRAWTIDAAALSAFLIPGPNGLRVDETAFGAILEPIALDVDVAPRNARFERVDGRVTEFTGSASGRAVDEDATREAFEAALNGDAVTVALAVDAVKPDVQTAQVNDLGIVDVLGTGTSSYRGSPSNRIQNIRNGVSLLNGLLIAPGETFSLLNALKPFETANGYLPELVIKGDKIEPEIGGGLCQIGTTTFRAALNSGLTIAQRQNHSLVVSYYNDPSNGNPGTDATIYDPAPDFQFTNDTAHHILFEAEMLEETQDLRFTFWGTSDGRKGSYSPPVVQRWIGVGPAVVTETLDLAPGQKKCQAAHVGADTSFTYTVVKADGTVTEEVFTSHYRPLPELCLLGVEELSTQDDLQPPVDSVSSSQTAEDAPVGNDAADQPAVQTETE